MRFTTALASSLALLASSVVAHPGHDVSEEIRERREFLSTVKRADLSHCSAKLQARGIEKRNIARRAALANKARTKRGLKRRDLASIIATDHNSTELGYSVNTDASLLFSSNSSCVLTPEVTQGPYYVGGEFVRRDIRDTQEGVDTILDFQIIDVDTCEPVPSVYLEIWHCNSTGVYSGVVSSGNGVSTDLSNINTTFHRGIQQTSSDGVAQFETTFPGHYTSRATHIHVMVHTNATLYCNGTLGNDVVSSHVGQTFFDQTLISAVETVEPYVSNTQEITANGDDSVLTEETATGVDPFFQYTMLGETVSDGIFGWIAFGINTTNSGSVTPASFLYAEGGVANSASGGGGGGGGGSGGPPDGSPSGSGTASAPVATSTSA